VGTLGGGCVEGDIWFAAKELMKRGGSALEREYELNEDLAAQDGLVCGGTMYFLIDPAYRPDDYRAYASEIEEAYDGGRAVALASIVKSSGNGGRGTGEKLFVREDGSTDGTLGSGPLDREAVRKALDLMAYGRSEYVKAADGIEYFVEAYTTPPQMVLCGGGHVSKAIAPLAKSLGFRVFVTDDREEFASVDRFHEADIVVAKTPEDALPQLPINANSFVIIATRGHRYDNVALEAAIETPAKYVGLLGSRRKTILIYEDLIRNGVSVDRVREVRSPVGLDIHARTPAEIAVSIMAEVLMFRLGGAGAPMKLEDWRLDRIVEKVRRQEAVAAAD
jgi:xanthine dehydrogenase accessory factor